MKRQVLIASVLGFALFLIDYFVKSAIVQLPEGSVLFGFGPFGIEKLLNQHLFVWVPVPTIMLLILSIVVLIGVSSCILYFFHKKQYVLIPPLIFIWFGGVSNVLDRIVYHATIDYLKAGGLIGNIADILVVTGLLWIIWLLQHNKKAKLAPTL